MPRETLVGTRIRERRTLAGLRQAELARRSGISASYLNLIEHNRRRIGGKVLQDIARTLDVKPAVLADGAEASLIASLRDAVGDRASGVPELQRVEELANRFPAWSQLLDESFQRTTSLEKRLEAASDRLTHDPYLAAAFHDVLSSVTSIRSAASILSDTAELEPAWRDRFHRNLNEDSARLAESSQSLVNYFDNTEDAGTGITTPEDEVEAFLKAHNFRFPDFEKETSSERMIEVEADKMRSAAARYMLEGFLRQYRRDVQALSADRLIKAVAEFGIDPLQLANDLSVDVTLVMRRLASLDENRIPTPVGLVICDSSGALSYRKPVEGFAIPRFGAGCPVWPLYRSLSVPLQLFQTQMTHSGDQSKMYQSFAIAVPVTPPEYNQPPLLRAYMLILPLVLGKPDVKPPQKVGKARHTRVGVSCRLCVEATCAARREPSILAEGL